MPNAWPEPAVFQIAKEIEPHGHTPPGRGLQPDRDSSRVRALPRGQVRRDQGGAVRDGLRARDLLLRKGLGFRLGSTEPEQARRIRARSMEKVSAENAAEGKTEPTALQYQAAERELGFSETEYRWNWVPLGGYVKMMGQDDSKPGLVVNDPRSYTSKTVGQRMLVISAGVIMNIIFAGVAFMITFMAGLEVPEAVIGSITPMAPAQMAVKTDGTSAPLRVGDQILTINGTDQLNDFRKIALNAALAKRGQPLEIEVKRLNGAPEKVYITPEASGGPDEHPDAWNWHASTPGITDPEFKGHSRADGGCPRRRTCAGPGRDYRGGQWREA